MGHDEQHIQQLQYSTQEKALAIARNQDMGKAMGFIAAITGTSYVGPPQRRQSFMDAVHMDLADRRAWDVDATDNDILVVLSSLPPDREHAEGVQHIADNLSQDPIYNDRARTIFRYAGAMFEHCYTARNAELDTIDKVEFLTVQYKSVAEQLEAIGDQTGASVTYSNIGKHLLSLARPVRNMADSALLLQYNLSLEDIVTGIGTLDNPVAQRLFSTLIGQDNREKVLDDLAMKQAYQLMSDGQVNAGLAQLATRYIRPLGETWAAAERLLSTEKTAAADTLVERISDTYPDYFRDYSLALSNVKSTIGVLVGLGKARQLQELFDKPNATPNVRLQAGLQLAYACGLVNKPGLLAQVVKTFDAWPADGMTKIFASYGHGADKRDEH